MIIAGFMAPMSSIYAIGSSSPYMSSVVDQSFGSGGGDLGFGGRGGSCPTTFEPGSVRKDGGGGGGSSGVLKTSGSFGPIGWNCSFFGTGMSWTCASGWLTGSVGPMNDNASCAKSIGTEDDELTNWSSC